MVYPAIAPVLLDWGYNNVHSSDPTPMGHIRVLLGTKPLRYGLFLKSHKGWFLNLLTGQQCENLRNRMPESGCR